MAAACPFFRRAMQGPEGHSFHPGEEVSKAGPMETPRKAHSEAGFKGKLRCFLCFVGSSRSETLK